MTALEIQVTIGDVAMNSVFSPGPYMYLLRNTEEILGALGTRRTDTPKQGEHGSEDSLSSYDPRILHFTGEIYATSQAERVTMQQALDEAVCLPRSQSFDGDDGYKLILITDEDGVAKQLYAKVVDMPAYTVIDSAWPEARRFEFTMFASDPAVYAQTLSSFSLTESYVSTTFTFQDGALPTFQDTLLPGVQDDSGSLLSVTTDGNFAAPPLIVISGPTTNPVVRNETTAKELRFNRNGGVTLLSGETLTINVEAFTAVKTVSSVDTNVRTNIALASEWFDIVPGTNEISLFDDTASELTSQLTISFRDSWV